MKKASIQATKFIVSFFALLLVGGCSSETITIISTNDIHSEIDNFPKLATFVEEQRESNPGKVLLFDSGDRWTGNPYVDIAPERYKPIIDLINELDFDAATFGNHEWDRGVDRLRQRTNQANFKKVLANADLSSMVESGMDSVPPYIYFEVDGLRIGVLGLITVESNGYPVGKTESFGKNKFFDPFETAERYRAIADSCDIYIALTHIGHMEDSLLAMQRPELDLILGGHTHTVVPIGKMINGVMVTQTGHSLSHVGVTKIKHRDGKILKIENKLVELDNIKPKERFQTMVDRYKNEPYLHEKVGSIATPLSKQGLMRLYSDIIRYGTKTDVAFHNLGGMRIESLPEGDVERVVLYRAEPFRNSPHIFKMSGEDIKQLIVNKFNSTGRESHTLDLYPSGVGYKVITDSKGDATDVQFFDPKEPGKIIKLDRPIYRVALSDYVGAEYNFPQRGKGERSGLQITNIAEDYLSKYSPYRDSKEVRVVMDANEF